MKLSKNNIATIEHLLGIVASHEKRMHYMDYPKKIESKQVSIGMFPPEVNKILEIGGDESSGEIFKEKGMDVTQFGLHIGDGQDMHLMEIDHEYDGVYARHVLEHSPFPLLVMYNIHRAVRGGGWVVIVVPQPGSEFVDNWVTHLADMSILQWTRIFSLAGFKVMDTIERMWVSPEGQEASYETIFLLKK